MIFRYDDQPNQSGYWFSLLMTKQEMDDLRAWLKENLGGSTQMAGNLSKGWYPLKADRKWTIHKFNGGYTLAIWDKLSASLFMTFHDVRSISDIPRPWGDHTHKSQFNYRTVGIDTDNADGEQDIFGF